MSSLKTLANIIKKSATLIIYAGAGMSVELGIPTYWEGTTHKYGQKKTPHGLTQIEHATEQTWHTHLQKQIQHTQETRKTYTSNQQTNNPNLYTQLLKTLTTHNINYFIITSNVDNAFQHYRYNPEKIYEPHGNYFYDQCLHHRNHPITHHNPKITTCSTCSGPLRPNILLFQDTSLAPERETQQRYNYNQFLNMLNPTPQHTTILEIGVGTTVLNLKNLATKTWYKLKTAPYIHLNPHPNPTNNYTQIAHLTNKTQPTAPQIWVPYEAENLTPHLTL